MVKNLSRFSYLERYFPTIYNEISENRPWQFRVVANKPISAFFEFFLFHFPILYLYSLQYFPNEHDLQVIFFCVLGPLKIFQSIFDTKTSKVQIGKNDPLWSKWPFWSQINGFGSKRLFRVKMTVLGQIGPFWVKLDRFTRNGPFV